MRYHNQLWLPVGGGLSGRGAGGAAGAAVHGGLGFEAHPQAGPERERGHGDYEQPVQCSEGQPDPGVAAEKHQPENQPGGGLRLGEVELYPQKLSLGLLQLQIKGVQG